MGVKVNERGCVCVEEQGVNLDTNGLRALKFAMFLEYVILFIVSEELIS